MKKRRQILFFRDNGIASVSWILLLLCMALFILVWYKISFLPSKMLLFFLSVFSFSLLISGLALNYSKVSSEIFTILNCIFCSFVLFAIVFMSEIYNGVKGLFNVNDVVKQSVCLYKLQDNQKSNRERIIVLSNDNYSIVNKALLEYKSKTSNNKTAVLIENNLESAIHSMENGIGDCLLIEDKNNGLKEKDDLAKYIEQNLIEAFHYDEDTYLGLESNSINETFDAIFIAGVLTENGEDISFGKTKLNYIVLFSKTKDQILLLDIPKELYVSNPALNYNEDLLESLETYGVNNVLNGLSDFFNINIRKYMLFRLNDLEKVIDSLGGIYVDNPFSFALSSENDTINPSIKNYYPKGIIRLNGKEAMAFIKEKRNLPNGEEGRRQHIKCVISGLKEALLQPSSLFKYNSVFDSIKGSITTNIRQDSLYNLISEKAFNFEDIKVIYHKIETVNTAAKIASDGWTSEAKVGVIKKSEFDFIKKYVESFELNTSK